MKNILFRAFGGLSLQYYLRQFMFGSLFALLMVYIFMRGNQAMPWNMVVFLTMSTLLYPYSRFVYETIMSFILGKNVFWVNAIAMLVVKFITMTLCWSFAVFIAPIGLLFLYFRGQPSKV